MTYDNNLLRLQKCIFKLSVHFAGAFFELASLTKKPALKMRAFLGKEIKLIAYKNKETFMTYSNKMLVSKFMYRTQTFPLGVYRALTQICKKSVLSKHLQFISSTAFNNVYV